MGDYNVDMSKIDTALNNNANNIIAKADKADMTAKLATKADTSDMTAKLATKADTSDMTAKLATKADTSDVTSALATKADAAETTAALATKADTSDMTAKLATKADTNAVGASSNLVRGPIFSDLMRVSHRCGTGWPEQSITGAKWCIANGLSPEFDVQQIADGTLVLCHDDTTTRTMLGTSRSVASVANLTEWKKYRLMPTIAGGYTEVAPTLEEMLQNAGSNGLLNCECKALTQSNMTAMCDMLDRYHMVNHVIVTCFDRNLCKYAASRGYSTMWNLNSQTMAGVNWASVRSDGIDWVAPQLNDTTSDTMRAMHSAGLKVDLWLIDTFSAYNSARALGADGLTGNYIDYIGGTNEHTGNPYHGGRALFKTPVNKSNPSQQYQFTTAGVQMMGDKIAFNGYNNNDYQEIVPFEENHIRLDDANKKAYNITIEGMTGNSQGTDDLSHVFTVGIFADPTNPDNPWVDDGRTSQLFATIYVRRNGKLGYTFANGSSLDVHNDAVDTGIAPGLNALKYTASITFHQGSITIRYSSGTTTFQAIVGPTSSDHNLPSGTDFQMFQTFSNQDTGTVFSVATRRESDGVAGR
jgi:glycerophosphoryl diester phosphodiesterase